MPASERRMWKCPRGHVIGEVKYLTRDKGVRVRALMQYDRSETKLPDELPALRAKLIGDAYDVRCTICGTVRDWYMGEDAINELLEKRKARKQKVDNTVL